METLADNTIDPDRNEAQPRQRRTKRPNRNYDLFVKTNNSLKEAIDAVKQEGCWGVTTSDPKHDGNGCN